MADEEEREKVLYMFIKKEENFIGLTIYKIESVQSRQCVQYCGRWAPKVILVALFSVSLMGT